MNSEQKLMFIPLASVEANPMLPAAQVFQFVISALYLLFSNLTFTSNK